MPAGRESLLAGALVVLAVGLHVAAMFPDYPGSPARPVTASADETAIYICLEVGWALAALLVLTRLSVRGGAAFGAGLGAVELGLLLTDTASGLQVSNDAAPGIWLAWAGLGAGLAGVCLAASSVPMLEVPRGLPSPSMVVRSALTVPVAIVAVAAFWPSWDHYHLVSTTGHAVDLTIGNAFSQPTGVMVGEVLAGVAIGVVAIVASLWSPPWVGAWATAGVVLALASQLISGVVQVNEPLSATLGPDLSGLDVHASSLWLTASWGIDLAAAIALACLAVWAALEPGPARGRSHGNLDLATTSADGDFVERHEAIAEKWPANHRWPGA